MTWPIACPGESQSHGAGRILMMEPYRGGGDATPEYLRKFGYLVQRKCTMAGVLRRLDARVVNLCIVDGELGAAAVLDACARLQGLIAVIVLAPPGGDELGIAALEAGADDYLTAPLNLRELAARIRALLRARRRRKVVAPGRIGESLVLHDYGRLASADGRSVRLTPTQLRLLQILSTRPGEVLPRAELMDLVFGDDHDVADRIIDVHVSRLRKQLARVGAADLVRCCRGVGYCLADAGSSL